MKTSYLKPLVLTALAGALCTASQAKTLTISLDFSGSNPLLSSQTFANEAALYTAKAVEALRDGDVVRLRTFGAREDARNIMSQSATIGRRVRAQKVAEGIGNYLRTLPQKKDAGQASTNLLAWLEFSSDFGCPEGGEILVITDGVESSTQVDAKALLEGKASLPRPDVNLKGCGLTFYGLGAGWSAQHVKRLRSEWSRWAEKAGARFTAVIP